MPQASTHWPEELPTLNRSHSFLAKVIHFGNQLTHPRSGGCDWLLPRGVYSFLWSFYLPSSRSYLLNSIPESFGRSHIPINSANLTFWIPGLTGRCLHPTQPPAQALASDRWAPVVTTLPHLAGTTRRSANCKFDTAISSISPVNDSVG